MADPTDTTPVTNSPTTETPSVPKDESQAPGSSDTNSSTTEKPSTSDEDSGSLLNPKDAPADGAQPEGEDGKTGDEGEPPANAALFGAPEEGADYEITGLPEGVTIDAAALAAVTPLARELNLSSEGLSKLAGVYTESVLPGVVTQLQNDLAAQAAQVTKDWATDARASIVGGQNAAGETVEADPIYAGRSLAEVQQVSAKALDKLGGDGFREFLDQHGLGNHPQMLRFAFAAGSAISEDTSFERGGGVPSAPLTREEKYYGKQA